MNGQKTRRRAIRQWTCPNHPGGPPTLPADGYEREELTLEQAYDTDFVVALQKVLASARPGAKREAALVKETFGLCCIGCEWKTVGYETVEVSPYEELLLSMRPPPLVFPTVLLAEFGGEHLGEIRIPIVKDGKP